FALSQRIPCRTVSARFSASPDAAAELALVVELRRLVHEAARLDPVAHLELREDLGDVALHGLGAQVQRGCDLAVGETLGEKGHHLALSLREPHGLARP